MHPQPTPAQPVTTQSTPQPQSAQSQPASPQPQPVQPQPASPQPQFVQPQQATPQPQPVQPQQATPQSEQPIPIFAQRYPGATLQSAATPLTVQPVQAPAWTPQNEQPVPTLISTVAPQTAAQPIPIVALQTAQPVPVTATAFPASGSTPAPLIAAGAVPQSERSISGTVSATPPINRKVPHATVDSTPVVQTLPPSAEDGIRIAELGSEKKMPKNKPPKKHHSAAYTILIWVRDIGIALLLVFIVMQVFKPTIVKEMSMMDTLHPNDYVFVAEQSYNFGDMQRGDIIVFHSDLENKETGGTKNLIKRIIGLPGDTVSIKEGTVYVNNEEFFEPYLKDGYTNTELDEVLVPDGMLFVMGDNRQQSLDSRDPKVGFVDAETVIGKAVFRLFPFNKMGKLV
jgi:signal peptidase I